MAKGVRPPDPEIARMPRGGTPLTHRVAVVLGSEPLPLAEGWPGTPTPRAAAEPHLDGWVGSLLGDPNNVWARVSYSTPRSGQPSEKIVTVADLRLRPLDVLALPQEPQGSELDTRVTGALEPGSTDIRIDYTADPAWDMTAVRTFPQLLEFANAI